MRTRVIKIFADHLLNCKKIHGQLAYEALIASGTLDKQGTLHVDVQGSAYLKFVQEHVKSPEGRVRAIASTNAFYSWLWAQLHKRALSMTGDTEVEAEWFETWMEKIPCVECKKEAHDYVSTHMLDLSSPAIYFKWTVDFHNYVNVLLKKPVVSVEEAKERWSHDLSNTCK